MYNAHPPCFCMLIWVKEVRIIVRSLTVTPAQRGILCVKLKLFSSLIGVRLCFACDHI